MAPRIAELRVCDFRGVRREVRLPLDGKSLLLLGENGTGKSTLVDAIEWATTGVVQPLSSRGQRVTFASHAHHVHADRDDATASVTLDTGAVISEGRVVGAEAPDSADFLSGARRAANILRRSELLSFINLAPAPRYERLKPFLPLLRIGDWETRAREARDEIERRQIEVRRSCTTAETALGGVGVAAPCAESDVLKTLRDAATTAGVALPESVDEAGAVSEQAQARAAEIGNVARIQALDSARAAVRALRQSPDIGASGRSLLLRLNAHREATRQEALVFYDRVLTEGAAWIREEERSACPLCDAPIQDRATLLARIATRLTERERIFGARAELRAALVDCEELASTWVESAESARDCLLGAAVELDVADIEAALAIVSALRDACLRPIEEFEREAALPDASLPNGLATALATAEERLTSVIDGLPRAEQLIPIVNLKACADAIASWWQPLQSERSRLVALTVARDRAVAFETALASARRTRLQAVFDDIQDDARAYFADLHPNEPATSIGLRVREVAASAQLESTFADQEEEDPRAYFSDGHLDTLGLCFFLALYARAAARHPNLRLLVLDDVLTSVDAPHRRRVAHLVLDKFRDHQLVLTTHDPVWFRELKDVQSQLGLANRFINRELRDWSLRDGPVLVDPPELAVELRRLIATNAETGTIAGSAGRLLEFLLSAMHGNFRLSVTGKPAHDYTIADRWPPFRSKVVRGERAPGLYARAQTAIDDLDLFTPIRNAVGGHWNDWAQGISRAETIAHANSVLGIFDAVHCMECRGFVVVETVGTSTARCRCHAVTYEAAAPGQG